MFSLVAAYRFFIRRLPSLGMNSTPGDTFVKSPALIVLLTGALFALPALAVPDNRDVVHNSYGNIVVNSFGNCVRTKWVSNTDECAAPQMARRIPIAQEERTVYFDFNKATLDAE